MTLQGQLAQAQEPIYLPSPDWDVPDLGMLANRLIQTPSIWDTARVDEPISQPGSRVLTHVSGSESGELEWLETNANELERYSGEWLLIERGELLEHSQDFSVIRARIQERRIASPFVYYVPTNDESNFVAI